MRIFIGWIGLAVLIVLTLAAAGARADTLTNTAGAAVEMLTADADSGAVQANAAGATLEALTTDQESADLRDPAGAWAFVGPLDPDWAGNAARLWALYE